MDPEFARLAGPLVRFLDQRAKRSYPDALMFGVTFPVSLAKEVRERSAARDASFTPAACVSGHMLDSDRLRTATGAPWFAPRTDFEFSIQYRSLEDDGRLKRIAEEIQAYADAVVVFVAATQWFVSGRPATALVDFAVQWPPFAALKDATRASSQQFLRAQQQQWAKAIVRREASRTVATSWTRS